MECEERWCEHANRRVRGSGQSVTARAARAPSSGPVLVIGHGFDFLGATCPASARLQHGMLVQPGKYWFCHRPTHNRPIHRELIQL
ncbi:hypothetical protein J6590_061855 [Homalodisca vitripennis]|nr:hypothetical protein J6590_061855 [Homalodisca vitripennis]